MWTRDGGAREPGVELVDRPPERLLRVANPLLARLLRSPLHPVVSGSLLLLTVTGRRTGTEYTFPVGYERRGDRLFVTTHHTNWWRNVREDATVEVVLRGERRRGRARVVTDPDEVARYLADAIDRHGRRYATRLGVRLTGEGLPTRDRLRDVAAEEIRLVAIDLD
jgi:deazaflavin-dependent oxidoreductase (nitroreductase family)